MNGLTWEQKLAAFQAISDHSLRMRKPGDWYVDATRLEIKESPDSSVLVGTYGNGATPAAAVEDHWRKYVTDLAPGAYIVANAFREDRKHYRWNGFMWAELPR